MHGENLKLGMVYLKIQSVADAQW